jgi:hypothetical protein
MPRAANRYGAGLRGGLGVAALLGASACTPRPYTVEESLRRAEVFLTPRPFTATRAYDEDGRAFALGDGPHPGRDRRAVRSYRVPPGHPLEPYLADRSFVYDDALAMIALSLAGRRDDARAIGDTLAALLTPDAALGFSFSLASPTAYNVRYVRAGAVAWAGYAMALHDALAHERRFTPVARRIADRLLASRISTPGDPRAGLVPAGRGAWRDHYRRFDAQHVAAYCATEHQIDAYFLLDALAETDPTGRYRAAADELAARLVDALWLPAEGRFAVAVTERGVVTDRALDAAGAWGALFLLARGDRARAERSLGYTLRTFARRGSGLPGYAPYAGEVPDYPGQDLSRTLFAEGTAGVALALLRVGRDREADALAGSLRALQREGDGGVLYATPGAEDFPELAAAAPTAWLLFLEAERRDRRAVVFGGAIPDGRAR